MSNKGTLLFLHSSSELYGASKILLQVLEVVTRMGFIPLVILPGPGPLQDAIENMGVEVKIINLAILRRKYFNLKGLFNRARRFINAYRQLSRICKERQVKIIYSNTLAVIVGAVFSFQTKKIHIWHIHEIIESPHLVTKFLSRLIDTSSSYPIVVSEAVKSHWEKYLKKSKPKTIFNGIDYAPYHAHSLKGNRNFLGIGEDKTVITMVGRINPGKGQLFFLEIAKRLIDIHGSTVHFLMVGDAYPGYENIEQKIEDYILSHLPPNQITQLGFRTDIPEILNVSDIFVLPSVLPDSFPTVILEAMASGLPIVATRSGGASEMVEDNVSGYLIPLGDVDLGAEKISYLIQHKNFAKTMGKMAKNQVLKQYSLEAFNQNIEDYLCQIIP